VVDVPLRTVVRVEVPPPTATPPARRLWTTTELDTLQPAHIGREHRPIRPPSPTDEIYDRDNDGERAARAIASASGKRPMPRPFDPRSHNRMALLLALGAHLRRLFDDVVSSSLPQRLADLVGRVKSDEERSQGQ
jgi:hypothetical protein